MVRQWLLDQLELVKDKPHVLVRDSLRLLPEVDGGIDAFGQQNGFAVVIASTNLAFRNHYEQVVADPEVHKVLVIDRAPKKRHTQSGVPQAPPPFYPDLLAVTPPEARIEVDLRRLLIEQTGDPDWPMRVSEPRYARLIVPRLPAVLEAHHNLRTAHPGRFTDRDFETIVAFAALGIGDAAFKQLDPQDCWRIGLLGHEALEELDRLVPDVTKPIRAELAKAHAPFCWFAEHDPELVIRAFYLSAVLSQHLSDWSLLLANIDPALKPLSAIADKTLRDAAPKLVNMNPEQASRDLQAAEESLDCEALQLVLIKQANVESAAGFAAVLERERLSALFASLALLMALDNLLSAQPDEDGQTQVESALSGETKGAGPRLLDLRPSPAWSNLREAYRLARQVRGLLGELNQGLRTLKVKQPAQLTFADFRELWNVRQTNRLEYYASGLERLVGSAELLPRPDDQLPSAFGNALSRIRERVRATTSEVGQVLDELNACFQGFVAEQYPRWVAGDPGVTLTSHFLGRVVKPHWDPSNEDAVVLVFDGMRYDIWDELLRPMLEDRLEVIEDVPGCSLLPSETHVTRKAISAGTFPDSFDTRRGEDALLADGLAQEFGGTWPVEEVAPDGAGYGEVIRYRSGRLRVCILELCDKILHGITLKVWPDGRQVPSRPLDFIYRQHIKNLIDTEVMALVRGLQPGTKVFVVADHGFGPVGRQPLWFDKDQLYDDRDCKYTNCRLRDGVTLGDLAGKVRSNAIGFQPQTLRMPETLTVLDPETKQSTERRYGPILFPKVGYCFKRPKGPHNPDAYSHGGISIQELVVPMVVLRVRQQEEGLLSLGPISGPDNIVEGEVAEFALTIKRPPRKGGGKGEMRVDVDAAYCQNAEGRNLPHHVRYVPPQGTDVTVRFVPDPTDASDGERREQVMRRTLTVTVTFQDGRRTQSRSQTKAFTVKLNSEQVVRRVPPKLGNILGLTPKSMRD